MVQFRYLLAVKGFSWQISSNLHLRQSLSRIIRFITSYRHPSPIEAWGFVPFLLDVPNSSRVSFVVGILIPEPSAARTKLSVEGRKSRFRVKVSVMMTVKFIKSQWVQLHPLFQIAGL